MFSEQTYLMFKRFPIPVFYNWHKIVSTINTSQRLFSKDETLFQNNTKMNIYSKHSITKKALLIKHSIRALFYALWYYIIIDKNKPIKDQYFITWHGINQSENSMIYSINTKHAYCHATNKEHSDLL